MTVLNLRTDDCSQAVRIDRTTKWGNPFRIGIDGNRQDVIKLYRSWLEHCVKTGQIDKKELAALHGCDLACWCKPKDCHGDVLEHYAAAAARELKLVGKSHTKRTDGR